MNKFSFVALVATALVAVPASATVSLASVASISANGNNVRFVRNAAGTTANLVSGTANTASWTGVDFRFGAGQLATTLGTFGAEMFLNLTANSAATTLGSVRIQAFNSGTISFRTLSEITLGSSTFAAGSNLLSYSFGDNLAALAGSGKSGSVSVAGAAGDFTVSSDFLNFVPVAEHDFSIGLSGLSVNLGHPAGQVLNNFTGIAAMEFNTDVGATVIPAIPEPANWLMLITGFGLVGGLARVRRSTPVSAA